MTDRLDGTTWLLFHPVAPEGAKVVLGFADGSVTGSSGCNRFRGGYSLDREELSFGLLLSTQMACSDTLMAFEHEVLERLSKVKRFSVSQKSPSGGAHEADPPSEQLALADDHTVLLVFNLQPDDGHLGEWVVTGIHYPDRQAIISVDSSHGPVTITFQPDRVHGHSGCNSFAGHLDIERDAINIGPLMSTRKICEGGHNPSIMEQEAALLRAVEHTIGLRLEGERLTMLRADGGIAVSLSRK
ncbi:MAG: META domain-containing protein [Actinomycetota bacterium]